MRPSGSWCERPAPGAAGDPTAEVPLAALDGLLLHGLLDAAVNGLAVGVPLRRLAGVSGQNPPGDGAKDD